jgi:hypothetical protein
MSQAMLGWVLVGIGALLVAGGGMVTTFGWDKIRAQKQSRNVATGVVRELALNEASINSAKELAARWPSRAPGESFPYEPFQNDHALGLVTSGALDPTKDRDALEALENYQREIARFNALLRIVGRTNPGLFIKADLIPVGNPADWPADPSATYADAFTKLVAAHGRAVKATQAQFPWASTKAQP